MRKKRILLVGESSFLRTGYSTYGMEVMKRLHATGKYELAELGCYGQVGDMAAAYLPWQFFHNMPRNDSEQGEYNSRPTNQFGEWRFEQTCLQFRPDIVFDIRDWWMLEFQARSPFRPFFHWAIMPTVDSQPQDEQWMATYQDADAVFTYSDWGLEQLYKQGRGTVPTKCSAPPGADLQSFGIIEDKAGLRQKMGIPANALVVGTIMRNQKRKLFPDLIDSFSQFLREAPKEISSRAYLYLHTSYPDIGWDIPRLLKEAGVSHRTFMTYVCRACNGMFPSLYQDVRGVCKNCGNPTATLPNTAFGVPPKALAAIINLFDVYVQYAIAEGFGMPQVEAAACGVPVMAVDYSAMADVVRKLKGIPIPVQRLYREPETHCWRALPDNNLFVQQLAQFFSGPESLRKRKGQEARRAVEKHYTYDRTAKIWEDHFDSVPLRPPEETWKSPPRIHQPQTQVPPFPANEEFVRWGLTHVAGRPDLVNGFVALRMMRDLQNEASQGGMGGIYINEASNLGVQMNYSVFRREEAMNELLNIAGHKNHWEKLRVQANS
jgi:glycosyltransferase involved in cell wall biosynthesis